MTSPFPGMNPYLENPKLWSEFHDRLINVIADEIKGQIDPRYQVSVEKNLSQNYNSVVISTSASESFWPLSFPDIDIVRQSLRNFGRINYPFLSGSYPQPPLIYPLLRNLTQQESIGDFFIWNSLCQIALPPVIMQAVTVPMLEEKPKAYPRRLKVDTAVIVTVIELLSPENKCVEERRNTYEENRQRVLNSWANFVEIDLLRDCEPMTICDDKIQSDYHILVSPGQSRPQAIRYCFRLQDKIPTFSVPLLRGDREPLLDLLACIQKIFSEYGFDPINYQWNVIPPFNQADADWVNALLKNSGFYHQ